MAPLSSATAGDEADVGDAAGGRAAVAGGVAAGAAEAGCAGGVVGGRRAGSSTAARGRPTAGASAIPFRDGGGAVVVWLGEGDVVAGGADVAATGGTAAGDDVARPGVGGVTVRVVDGRGSRFDRSGGLAGGAISRRGSGGAGRVCRSAPTGREAVRDPDSVFTRGPTVAGCAVVEDRGGVGAAFERGCGFSTEGCDGEAAGEAGLRTSRGSEAAGGSATMESRGSLEATRSSAVGRDGSGSGVASGGAGAVDVSIPARVCSLIVGPSK